MTRPAAAPRRPAAHAEGELVRQILSGQLGAGGTLPPERELATRLGVTRPTLREALQRLDRDGWIQVRHGKSTRVREVWREGGLNVLAAVVRHGGPFPPRFVTNLLEVRLALAPAYARAAVAADAEAVAEALAPARRPGPTAEAFAAFDWGLHVTLCATASNPVFTLILNGFADFYGALAVAYFEAPAARRVSSRFYDALAHAARRRSPAVAEKVTRAAMSRSLSLWSATERRLGAFGGLR